MLPFTLDETKQLAGQYCRTEMSDTRIEQIYRKTDGWVAGLIMAMEAARDGNISVILLMFFMAICVSIAHAEPKTITLKDGSQIKGEILSLSDGACTLKTETLGQITIRDKDIVRITTGIPVSKASGPAKPSLDSQQIQSQVIRMQSALVGDPGMMHEIVIPILELDRFNRKRTPFLTM